MKKMGIMMAAFGLAIVLLAGCTPKKVTVEVIDINKGFPVAKIVNDTTDDIKGFKITGNIIVSDGTIVGKINNDYSYVRIIAGSTVYVPIKGQPVGQTELKPGLKLSDNVQNLRLIPADNAAAEAIKIVNLPQATAEGNELFPDDVTMTDKGIVLMIIKGKTYFISLDRVIVGGITPDLELDKPAVLYLLPLSPQTKEKLNRQAADAQKIRDGDWGYFKSTVEGKNIISPKGPDRVKPEESFYYGATSGIDGRQDNVYYMEISQQETLDKPVKIYGYIVSSDVVYQLEGKTITPQRWSRSVLENFGAYMVDLYAKDGKAYKLNAVKAE